MTAKSWVSNDTDSIVAQAQGQLRAGSKLEFGLMSKLMDLVSGVENYDPRNMSKQGVIAKFFNKEISKTGGVLKSANYLINLEDLVSVFWENVLETIPTAKKHGDTVEVREVAGSTVSRPTQSNSIYYIRSQSITKTRNYINAIYAKMLVQSCETCNGHSPPHKEEVHKACVCGSTNSVPIWPDGNTKYRAKKMRRCEDCQATWRRRFEYRCGKCGSGHIAIRPKNISKSESFQDDSTTARSVEDEALDLELEQELADAFVSIRQLLPKNPSDKAAQSKTMELFDMIVDRNKTVDMCAKCRLSAPTVCVKKCTKSCAHERVLDSRASCGATEFSLTACVNYSKKIGEHVGCSASLVARRMKQIRATTVQHLNQTKNSSEISARVLKLLEGKGSDE